MEDFIEELLKTVSRPRVGGGGGGELKIFKNGKKSRYMGNLRDR